MFRALFAINILPLGVGAMPFSSWLLLGTVLTIVPTLLIMSLLVYALIGWLLGRH